MVPEVLVEKCIAYAHESTLSSHMGMGSTVAKLTRDFYFPGVSGKVKRFVRSCDICQRAATRSVGRKAPLLSMKIASNPFEEVYIDLVGEIVPASAEGHRWMLTMLDSATKFPIAIPLKRTDSVTICEALQAEFSIYGFARRIVCDNGANLNSAVLQDVYRMCNIELRNSPVYCPQNNSCLERSHAVMKSILKKLTMEQPREWHRYVPALLFAMRNTPNASGFSPFELLFGRSCFTHLGILRTLWTGEVPEPEVKTTYQYVLDLQERIEETCKLAREELKKVQGRNQKRWNKNSKLRELTVGQKVLYLVPLRSNKLQFQWKGPAEVCERKGIVTYKIRLKSGKERTYHINLLKEYVSRQKENEQTGRNDGEDDEAWKRRRNKEVEQEEDEEEDLEIFDRYEDKETLAAVMGVVEESDEEEEGVSMKDMEDLYNLQQKETWEDVRVNPELPKEEYDRYKKLLWEYRDIFSDVPTTTHLVEHSIKLTSQEPIALKPYHVPIHLEDRLEKEIKCLLDHGWIEESDSPYAAPVVCVGKKGTSDIRLCVNYKQLNDITVTDPMPAPDIDDILDRIGKARIFSTIDATKGYYAIPMSEESKDLTGFVVPNNQYRFKVLPFGLKNSSRVYSRLLKKILQGSRNLENYVDDIIAHDEERRRHEETLRDLFTRVRNANIKLKPSKARIGYFEVEFLGHRVSAGQVRPTNTHIEKICGMQPAKTKSDVRAICGAVNFLRKFIPDCAGRMKALTDLTGKNQPEHVRWGKEQQEALDEVKGLLTREPVLRLYNAKNPHVLRTDASDHSIGGVLLEEVDNDLHPVFYMGRKLLDREKRYPISQKEALAVVWCIERSMKYLYGCKFKVQTDCEALTILRGKMSTNARIMRWQLKLQSYDFSIEVIRGVDNDIADCLTRAEIAD
jgi:hypothetical protein